MTEPLYIVRSERGSVVIQTANDLEFTMWAWPGPEMKPLCMSYAEARRLADYWNQTHSCLGGRCYVERYTPLAREEAAP